MEDDRRAGIQAVQRRCLRTPYDLSSRYVEVTCSKNATGTKATVVSNSNAKQEQPVTAWI
jgi:hypothetical protein